METLTTAAGAPKEKLYFKYQGDLGAFALLFFKNLLLSIITLGIYRAWARTNVRRYLWNEIFFLGDRGSYKGTGKELFIGWLKMLGVMFAMLIGWRIVNALLSFVLPAEASLVLATIGTSLIYIYIFSIAVYSGLRYRLARTVWRGIKFGMFRDKESAREFTALYIKGFALSMVTLGIYSPFFKNETHKYLVDRMKFGTKSFSYSGAGKEYFFLCLKGLILTLVTAGIYLPWFMRETLKYRLQHTHFGDGHFDHDLTGIELLLFFLGAFGLLVISLGLATPVILHWAYGLFANKIYFEGVFDLQGVMQAASDGDAMADELVSAYDLDFGF